VARGAVTGVRWRSLALVAALPLLAGLPPPEATAGEFDLPYDPYVPTPHSIVERMLALAEVGADDLVVDLGSGDGRIVITAARQFGARGLGIEIDRSLVAESQEHARKEGVAGRTRFIARDLFDADLREATVLTLYLLPETNRKLLPKILAEMRPGTRVVAHRFAVGDWRPDVRMMVDASEDWSAVNAARWLYLWYVPARVAGEWEVVREGGGAPFRLALDQAYQHIAGAASDGAARIGLELAVLRGNEIRFVVPGSSPFAGDYAGRIDGETMSGDLNGGGRWRAVRRKAQ
jgi:SAM-dependent methyltransferase